MKNTLKIVLLVIGAGFLFYALFQLISGPAGTPEMKKQMWAMMGVGALFVLGGFSMGKR